MPRALKIRQNLRKLPGCSGIVTANKHSRRSPSSARSAICRKRSKLTFAPQLIPISVWLVILSA